MGTFLFGFLSLLFAGATIALALKCNRFAMTFALRVNQAKAA